MTTPDPFEQLRKPKGPGYTPDHPNAKDAELWRVLSHVMNRAIEWYEAHESPGDVAMTRQLPELIRSYAIDQRRMEAGLWLDMVVRYDHSRLQSKEWYKLNPQDVLRFHADRITNLTKERKEL